MKINDAFRFNAKPCKACGAAFSVFASYQEDPARKLLVDARFGGKAMKTLHFWRADNGTSYEMNYWGGNELEFTCSCGRNRLASPVVGKYNPGKVCNARCQASTGHQCECSCRGKNHGAGHEARA